MWSTDFRCSWFFGFWFYQLFYEIRFRIWWILDFFSFPLLSSFFRPFLRFIYFFLFFPFSLLLVFLWMFFFSIVDFPDLDLTLTDEGWDCVCDKILKDGAWKSSELASSFNLLLFLGVSLPIFDTVRFVYRKSWRFEC